MIERIWYSVGEPELVHRTSLMAARAVVGWAAWGYHDSNRDIYFAKDGSLVDHDFSRTRITRLVPVNRKEAKWLRDVWKDSRNYYRKLEQAEESR